MVVGESLRWLELNLTTLPGSIFRWSSRWTPPGSGILSRTLSNVPETLMRGWSWWANDRPGFSNIVDSVFWSLVTAVESVALVSMLGYFFVFYGCTL